MEQTSRNALAPVHRRLRRRLSLLLDQLRVLLEALAEGRLDCAWMRHSFAGVVRASFRHQPPLDRPPMRGAWSVADSGVRREVRFCD
jgi:hypothetical protein